MSIVKPPFFSVVIPLYNKVEYVERAVRSVLSQSESDFEIVLVDDGSTDEGVKKIRNIDDQRIKIHVQENRGVASTRNKGAELATGKWLAFLDADDYWIKEHLSELKCLITTFPSAGMVSTSTQEIVEGGRVEDLGSFSAKTRCIINYFEEAVKNIGVINSSNVSIKWNAFYDSGGFADFRYGEDLEFWARIALCYPVAKSDKVTVIYYRGNGGAMETREEKNTDSKSPLPVSLSDVSPSLGLLDKRLPTLEKGGELYNSALIYIDSRLSMAIRGAFLQGDVELMRGFRKLSVCHSRNNFFWWIYFSGLPRPVIFISYKLRFFAKSIYSKFKKIYH